MALETCCGCISLRTGSITIGVLNLIGCLIYFIVVCVFSAQLDDLLSTQPQIRQLGEAFVNGGIAGVITYLVIMTAVSAMFIIGVVKRIARLIVPFLSVGFGNILITVCVLVASITMASIAPVEKSRRIWGFIGQYLVSAILSTYFFFVTYYYYQEMKNDEAHRGESYSPEA